MVALIQRLGVPLIALSFVACIPQFDSSSDCETIADCFKGERCDVIKGCVPIADSGLSNDIGQVPVDGFVDALGTDGSVDAFNADGSVDAVVADASMVADESVDMRAADGSIDASADDGFTADSGDADANERDDASE